ncbi:acetyltransferase [Rhizobium terrae]|uniref:acetyltransferase n=1 Tax=Rhizobium terrae TaxID=2171756 RepID=UPI000E3D4CF9|nr:acetyltransferase [Rhizobium terrae]
MKVGGKLLIVGTSEIGAMAHQYFLHDSPYEPVAFTVDEQYLNSDSFEGLPVVGLSQIADLYPPQDVKVFVAVGDGQLNRIRMSLYARLAALGYDFASYVSSKAFVWPNVQIGRNCFILEHNVLQPFVTIGNNVTLWSGNHIGHRSVIEDDVFISSHVVVSGFCTVGARSFIGVNAAMGNGVKVAPDNFIAMSSSIHASTEADGIYKGNPAERQSVSAKRFCRVRE